MSEPITPDIYSQQESVRIQRNIDHMIRDGRERNMKERIADLQSQVTRLRDECEKLRESIGIAVQWVKRMIQEREKLRVENEQLKKESNMKINCSEEVCQARFKALRAENAKLKDILDNLNIQAVRDVAKGWVSIPSVEWDAVNWDEILRPESDANQPKGEG